MPTIQSATAKLITKQLVTVRSRRVVITDRITSVFPNIVIMIKVVNRTTKQVFCHGMMVDELMDIIDVDADDSVDVVS